METTEFIKKQMEAEEIEEELPSEEEMIKRKIQEKLTKSGVMVTW